MRALSQAVLEAKIKAYDEFTATFRKFEAELRKLDGTQKAVEQQTHRTNQAIGGFYRFLGQVGLLFAFTQGLRSVAQAGREFELAIKQAQAVTGDMSTALRDFAMAASESTHGPTELAQAYYTLGSAGLSAMQTLAVTPQILKFATAGLLDMDSAAYAVTATIKAFQLEWEQTTQVTDAFTQAMNATALQAKDFQWIMSSAGAVAKLANQDFREIVGGAAAMKDAGIQAQDAGTSIKSALLSLIDPSKEAKGIMKDLGIEVYDAQGRMKQWHQIVGEFERVLKPYNEQSRNMILTTILGSDGIRAMATGLNMGSEQLAAYVEQMKAAQGTTEEMARIMEDSFDGTLKRLNGNLERTKILLFEDFQTGAMGFMGAINEMVVGFNALDESTRQTIEMLVGTAGLTAALMMVIGGIAKVRLALLELLAAEKGVGLLATLFSGPWGWVALGIGAAVVALISYAQAAGEAKKKQHDLNLAIEETKELEEGTKTISANQVDATKERIKVIDEEIAKLREKRDELLETEKAARANYMSDPTAGTTINASRKGVKELDSELQVKINQRNALNDAMEKAVVLDVKAAQAMATKAAQTKIEAATTSQLIDEYVRLAGSEKLTADEQKRLSELASTLGQKYPYLITQLDAHGNATKLNTEQLKAQKDVLNALAQAEMDNARATMTANLAKTQAVLDGGKQRMQTMLQEYQATRDLVALMEGSNSSTLGNADKDFQAKVQRTRAEVEQAEQAVAIYKAGLEGLGKIKIGGGEGGGKTYTPPGAAKKGKKSKDPDQVAAEEARKSVQGVEDALRSYRNAVDTASASVSALSGNEQYLTQTMQNGTITLAQITQLNRVRTLELKAIEDQQSAILKQREREGQLIQDLKAKLAGAKFPEQAKVYRDEIDKLTQSIQQSYGTWWQLENQQQSIRQQIKEDQDKRYSDAYDKAMTLMRHEVSMARMSTEQQIAFLQKLKAAHSWTQDQMWQIDEEMYRLRRDQLSKYMDGLTDEYNAKLKSLEDSTKASVKAIQDQIDALDQKGEDSDREEALRQHNAKMADLQKQRQYHEVRTGSEHQKALVDIDRQMADEEQAWKLQQDEWSREDQKDNLEKQKDAIEKNADEERKKLEEHYDKARKIAEDGIMDVIASLAATEPKWLDTGKQLIDALIKGLESGDFTAVQAQIEAASGQAGTNAPTSPSMPGSSAQNPRYQIGPGQYRMIGDSAAMWSQELGNLFGVPVAWNQSTGMVSIGGKWFKPLENKGGQSWVGIRSVAEALGYSVGWDQNSKTVSIYRAADGLMFNRRAFTEIAENEPEVAMPLSKFQPMMNEAVIRAGMNAQAMDRMADKIVSAINSRLKLDVKSLLNIEHYEASDEVDVDILTRSLKRNVVTILGS